MEALEAIFSRRSVRQFLDKPIPNEMVDSILKAAMAAPSAMNEQPWHFLLIRDKKLLIEIPKFSIHAKMCVKAPMSILVCGDLQLEKFPGLWVQSCSAATENILLAIHGNGLGGVWTGVYPNEDRVWGFRKLLHLPKEIVPFALIVLGYPDGKPSAENRYDPAKVHVNKW
ncbi:MAG: nitroreductase family protein [Chlamydiota bacterium]